MASSILIASDQGSISGTVERVVLNCDGGAREMWVRAGGRTKRVPIAAINVVGWSGQRTVDLGDFEAAPTLA